MNRDQATWLLDVARTLWWDLPSSSGRPVSPARAGDEALATLAAMRQDLAAAVDALSRSGDPTTAIELAARTWRLWMLECDVDGGHAFVATALVRGADESRWAAVALYGRGLFEFWQGDIEASHESNARALELAESQGDREAQALALLGLSRVALERGEFEAARSFAGRARAAAQKLASAMQQAPLHVHAQSYRMLGELDVAADLFQQSIELNRELGDRGMVAVEAHNLGHVEIRRGNVDAAEALFRRSAAGSDPAEPFTAALQALNEAAVAEGRGERARASRLLERVEAMVREARLELSTDDEAELQRLQRLVAAE